MLGHIYNDCDGCFVDIERASKLHEIVYSPEYWIQITSDARKKKKLEVSKMKTVFPRVSYKIGNFTKLLWKLPPHIFGEWNIS